MLAACALVCEGVCVSLFGRIAHLGKVLYQIKLDMWRTGSCWHLWVVPAGNTLVSPTPNSHSTMAAAGWLGLLVGALAPVCCAQAALDRPVGWWDQP